MMENNVKCPVCKGEGSLPLSSIVIGPDAPTPPARTTHTADPPTTQMFYPVESTRRTTLKAVGEWLKHWTASGEPLATKAFALMNFVEALLRGEFSEQRGEP